MKKHELDGLVAAARIGLRDDWEWREEVVTDGIVQLADRIAEFERAAETTRAEHADALEEMALLRKSHEMESTLRYAAEREAKAHRKALHDIATTVDPVGGPETTSTAIMAAIRAGAEAMETVTEHAAALGLATARIRELEGEREELLGLLREQALGEQCDVAESTDDNDADQSCMDTLDDDGVPRPDVNQPCWEHRRRAIVARIEKAAKGTT